MTEPYPSATCVFKIQFGTHYLVLKALRLHQALQNYSVQIDRDLRNGVKDGSILTKVIKHIHRSRVIVMNAEVVLASDDPVEILKKEWELLQIGKTDPKCLNVYFSVGFPQWVPQTAVAEFQAFLTEQSRNKPGAKKRGRKPAQKSQETVSDQVAPMPKRGKPVPKPKEPAAVIAPRRGPGRPAGSKNKPKAEVAHG